MNNWTIKKRIVAGFAIILGLVALLTVSSFFLLRQAKQAANLLATDAMPGLRAMSAINQEVGDLHMYVLRDLAAKAPEDHKKYRELIAAGRDQVLKLMADYEQSITTSEDRELFDKMKVARDEYVAVRGQLLDFVDAGKMDEAMRLNEASFIPAHQKYTDLTRQLMVLNLKNGDTETERTGNANNRAMSVILSISIIALVSGFGIAIIITGGLNKLLRRVAQSLDEGSTQVASAAGEVSGSSQSLAEGASEQAASLEETSASLEEMTSMTKRNAENAHKANELAKEARSAADRGVGDMRAMSSAMAAIKTSSDDIAKIIKTIDEIAFQTNILALNAAVEAARAGEAGMGFAVVAEEVRNLAQRSALAAKETAGKIEGAISKSGQGVQISNQVSETLNLIVTKVRQVDELIAEVASASREQTEGITQINTAVGQMDKVTQSNAANAEESAAAAEELNAQGATMKESVSELLHLVGRNGHDSSPATERISSVSRSTADTGNQQPRVPAEASSASWSNKFSSSRNSAVNEPAAASPNPAPRKLIEWKAGPMATGFESIDEQHRQLIDRINELHDACVAGTAREELLKMLAFLGNYADSHFKHEEGLMDKHRCPVSRQNKNAHAQFLADYQAVVETVKRDGATTAAVLKLREMLGNWLKKHICTMDTNMRRCAPGATAEHTHAA